MLLSLEANKERFCCYHCTELAMLKLFAGFLISDTLLALLLAVLGFFFHGDIFSVTGMNEDSFGFGLFSASCDNAFWVAFSLRAVFLWWYKVSSGLVMKEQE